MSGSENEAVPVIECREVTKVYRSMKAGRPASVCALDKVSLRVGSGTIIGLIGPNGAGKTTFLSLIAGLIFPTQGFIRVCGHAARSLEARRSLGYIPESPAFLSRYSARAVLEYHAALHGLSRRAIAAETDRLLAQLRLQEYADRAVGGFSLGMRQRLALAVALLDHPRLLLLDEPSNGLDPIGVIELRRVLLEIRQAGATIVISSHAWASWKADLGLLFFLHRPNRRVRRRGSRRSDGRLHIGFYPAVVPCGGDTDAVPAVGEIGGRIVVAWPAQDVPQVVSSLVRAGAQITGVALETPDIEQTFVRLYQERDGV
jgi:ABC-type multidrug transport system ATPase subunit